LAELQLWRVRLDTPPEVIAELRAALSADETQRADRFLIERVRNRFIASRGALRMVLAERLGLQPQDVLFTYQAQGKPALASALDPNLRFNLAHSADLALIALATGREVGVDVEFEQDRPDLFEVAQRFFAPSERNIIRQTPVCERQHTFYRIWTRKEAVLKGRGQGITGGLEAPDVSKTLSQDGLTVELGGEHWLVQELVPAQGYQAAVAVAVA
jgi:4'-phosphopantetheinyl transferase